MMFRYRIFWEYPDLYRHTIAVVSSYIQIMMVVTMLDETFDLDLIGGPPTEEDIKSSAVVMLARNTQSGSTLYVEYIRQDNLN